MKLQLAMILSVAALLSVSVVTASFAENPNPTLEISDATLVIDENEGTAALSFTANVESGEIGIQSIKFPTFQCAGLKPCVVEINTCVSDLDEEDAVIKKTFSWYANHSPPNGKIPAIMDSQDDCNIGPASITRLNENQPIFLFELGTG
ncbi:MAG: hypothetical protein OER82_02095 [Nitrosopumilus sp.]|nr:hypothetical protein [Nitrosopumilus sp.]